MKVELMKRVVIKDRTDPENDYLIRLRVLRTPWFGVFLHHILLPDADPNPHDHPWPFVSLVLRGGYEEHLYLRPSAFIFDRPIKHWRRRWSLQDFPTAAAHRVHTVLPGTVTLVIVGRHSQGDWGFWTKEYDEVFSSDVKFCWVPWQEYDPDSARPAA